MPQPALEVCNLDIVLDGRQQLANRDGDVGKGDKLRTVRAVARG